METLSGNCTIPPTTYSVAPCANARSSTAKLAGSEDQPSLGTVADVPLGALTGHCHGSRYQCRTRTEPQDARHVPFVSAMSADYGRVWAVRRRA